MNKIVTVAAPKNKPFISSTGMMLIVYFNKEENKDHLYQILGVDENGAYIL